MVRLTVINSILSWSFEVDGPYKTFDCWNIKHTINDSVGLLSNAIDRDDILL